MFEMILKLAFFWNFDENKFNFIFFHNKNASVSRGIIVGSTVKITVDNHNLLTIV